MFMFFNLQEIATTTNGIIHTEGYTYRHTGNKNLEDTHFDKAHIQTRSMKCISTTHYSNIEQFEGSYFVIDKGKHQSAFMIFFAGTCKTNYFLLDTQSNQRFQFKVWWLDSF